MKNRIAALSTLVLALVVVLVVKSASNSQYLSQKPQLSAEQLTELTEKEKKGWLTFSERLQLARARGQRKVTVPGNPTYYPVGSSIHELNAKLSDYTIVVAILIKKSSHLEGDTTIRTWNKFKMLDAIARVPPRPKYVNRPAVSDELLPIREDEIVVPTEGGTTMIDGLEVTQLNSDFEFFHEGQKYMLALSLDPTTRIGELDLGPVGFLLLNPDNSLNDRLEAEPLPQVLKTYHAGSLERLKEDLRSKLSLP